MFIYMMIIHIENIYKDGTYYLVGDDRQEALDRKEEFEQNSSRESRSSDTIQFDYGITFKLTE